MISIEFLYFFLPIFMGLYVAVSPKQRAKIVMLGTVILVGWANVWGLIPLVVSVFTSYLGGIAIDNNRDRIIKKRVYLIITLVINIGIFLAFAYSAYDKTNFLGGFTYKKLSLDLFYAFGVTSYVMHSVAYCVDIYKGKYRCEHSFSLVAEYIGFFPVMAAGPFLHFDKITDTLHNPVVSSEQMAEGIKLMLIGMFEKLLLSNTMYEVWNNVKSIDTMNLSVATAWVGVLAFSFSFYFELSAFSHFGRGLASMLGFEIEKNFNSPFMANGFSDFINRFNISLTSFAREYIYNNIFTKSKDKGFALIPALICGIICSLWYGFGFRTILWTVIIILLIKVEHLLQKPLSVVPYVFRCIGFNLLYMISIPVFALSTPSKAFEYILAMFGANIGTGDVLSVYLIRTSLLIFVLCIIFSTNVMSFFKKKINSLNDNVLIVIQPVYCIALLLLVTAFLISGNSQLFGLLF